MRSQIEPILVTPDNSVHLGDGPGVRCCAGWHTRRLGKYSEAQRVLLQGLLFTLAEILLRLAVQLFQCFQPLQKITSQVLFQDDVQELEHAVSLSPKLSKRCTSI